METERRHHADYDPHTNEPHEHVELSLEREREAVDAADPALSNRIIEEKTTYVNGRVHRSMVERARTFIRSDEDLEQIWLRGLRRTVYFVVHVVAIFILIRFFLLLAGANPENVFAGFIYGLTAIFMAPFNTIFGPSSPPTYGVAVLEPAALFAIAMYYLFTWIGMQVARIIVRRSRPPQRVERQPLPPTTRR